MQEQKRQLKLLTEEREAVAAEKAQLEVLNRLKTNSDDITKIEVQNIHYYYLLIKHFYRSCSWKVLLKLPKK